MKPSEIESFLLANKDLFGPGLGEQAVIATDDLHELFRRLFESQEYKIYTERERLQKVQTIFACEADADAIKGMALMPSELDKPEIKF